MATVNLVSPEIAESQTLIERLLAALPALRGFHMPGTPVYEFLKVAARQAAGPLFSAPVATPRTFGPFGALNFPFVTMGAIDSLDLFGLDELIMFSFYWSNRGRYRRVLDLGANIGLHSIVLGRCGFQVRSYEPDPRHFELFERNLSANGCASVQAVNAAVSVEAGAMEFVRVLGNTTGSHLAGSKPAPYGDLERFPVRVEAFAPLLREADLVKMDVEGHERVLLTATTQEQWRNADALVEIGNPENAAAVFEHFRTIGVNLFAQKTGWGRVCSPADMPVSYRDGTLFISCRAEMPWGAE